MSDRAQAVGPSTPIVAVVAVVAVLYIMFQSLSGLPPEFESPMVLFVGIVLMVPPLLFLGYQMGSRTAAPTKD